MEVKVPIGDADGEVAERVGRDVDAAVALLLQVTRASPGIGPLDPKLNLYRYLEKWKGQKEAIAWARANVPATSRQDLLGASLDARLFPLFWMARALPASTPDGEDLWLLQATAVAFDPKAAGGSSEEVRAHFASSSAPEARYGRLLLGLSDGQDLLVARTPADRGDAAYYLGVRALASGRREEASDWFLVCLAIAPAQSPSHRRAASSLRRWAEEQTASAWR